MKKMIGNGLDGFAKDKSCISYLIALCTKTTTSVDKERAVDAIYLYFSQAFDTGGPGSWAGAGSEPWQQRWPAASTAATAGALPGAQGRGVPSAQHSLDPVWVLWPVWCPPMQKDTDNLE